MSANVTIDHPFRHASPGRSLVLIGIALEHTLNTLRKSAAVASLFLVSASCAARSGQLSHALAPLCRDVVSVSSERLQWTEPSGARDRDELARWCGTIGPAVVVPTPTVSVNAAPDDVAVVSWNVHVGGGDIRRFVSDLRKSHAGHFVLLLQEAHRAGPGLPEISRTVFIPARIGHGTSRSRDDVVRVAEELGLAVFYAPAMRNGYVGLGEAEEDRGNAILSTLPLSDLRVIELPFVRQRRIAIAATVTGRTALGDAWTMRVASTHLETRLPAGRTLQARALLTALAADLPIVLGGDFNTLFGASEQAHLELHAAFPATPSTEIGRTFRSPLPLSLDHLYFRLPSGWTAKVARAAEHFGSDHYPIVASIAMPGSPALKSRPTAAASSAAAPVPGIGRATPALP
jgi:endonuclease/exonuclease/phosphatase family metal-dependent hydrolase